MTNIKRSLKKKIATANKEEDRIAMKRRKKIIKRIETTVNNLRMVGGGMKEATFWDFKRKLERKKEEQVTGMIDKDEKIVEERGDHEGI